MEWEISEEELSKLPIEVQKRYLSYSLKISDIIEYPTLKKRNIISHLDLTSFVLFCSTLFGAENFLKLIDSRPSLFADLEIKEKMNFKERKRFFENNGIKFKTRINSVEELMNLSYDTIIQDPFQNLVIRILGLDNLQKFEKETNAFSYKYDFYDFEGGLFDDLQSYLKENPCGLLKEMGIDFKYGMLSYDDFLKEMALLLNQMRKENEFEFLGYDFIEGEFRKKYPEIFISHNSPIELRKAFYENQITPSFLRKNPYFKEHLLDNNLDNTINCKLELLNRDGGVTSFINEYSKRYGNSKLLDLFIKYGLALNELRVGEIDDPLKIEAALREAIYHYIIDSCANKKDSFPYPDYRYLEKIPEFLDEYPKVFLNLDSCSHIPDSEKERIVSDFYNGSLDFEDISKYPEFKKILMSKQLIIPFRSKLTKIREDVIFLPDALFHSDLELLEFYGKNNFFELASKYGKYLNGMGTLLRQEFGAFNHKLYDKSPFINLPIVSKEHVLHFSDADKMIEKILTREVFLGNVFYQEDAPLFLKEKYPELFLDNRAPSELKKLFYSNKNNFLTFSQISNHQEWSPFLKDKRYDISLLRDRNVQRFVKTFGRDKAFKLGKKNPETVDRMLSENKIGIMKEWYDKTGETFIPDYIVMNNFPLEEVDKFLLASSKWSRLVKISSYGGRKHSKDEILKLAYSFGVFDNDQKGYTELLNLLGDIPRRIEKENAYVIEELDQHIFDIFKDFVIAFEKDNIKIDVSKPFFSQLYRKNEDGSYTLTINPEKNKHTALLLRKSLEKYECLNLLNPSKASLLFSNFKLKYDPDFREFLLKNMKKVLKLNNYNSLSKMQYDFNEIRKINSNRTLTWEMALNYVDSKRFMKVETGNEKMANIVSEEGYPQLDFNVLQEIYDYGRERVFSSIPRIEGEVATKNREYSYEILRLDDPLAIVIGSRTNCCQALNEAAELCMEHSMVDKNGRIFVVRDKNENIVAQSWVWRNKDVLCFDNIEIPDKVFEKQEKKEGRKGRKEISEDIYMVYEEAARDLMKEDKRVYDSLVQKGSLSKEDCDGLRLGKITVGLGYNDIAETIKENAKQDQKKVTKPLPFIPKVKLTMDELYTIDSEEQYVLLEREDRKSYVGNNIFVHNDSFEILDNSNFCREDLINLKRLEKEIREDSVLERVGENDGKYLVSEIGLCYDLKPEKTKIIRNSNFTIIYDDDQDKINIGDILYKTSLGIEEKRNIEDKVMLQMKLAINQIKGDKEIDISRLDEKTKSTYLRIEGENQKMNEERGLGHAK